jgi:hypothetical protein
MKRFAFAACTLALIVTSEAHGQTFQLGRPTEGFTYFNRPGADSSMHVADLSACLELSRAVASVDEGSLPSDRPAGLLPGWIASWTGGAARLSAVENCMVVKGWRVVRLPRTEGQAISRLPSSEAFARIEPWIGLVSPPGEIARVWRNDAATASTDRFELRPNSTESGLLSIAAVSTEATEAAKPAETTSIEGDELSEISDTLQEAKPEAPTEGQVWSAAPLNRARWRTIRSDAAVIVVQLRGVGFRNGTALTLSRLQSDADASSNSGLYGVIAAVPLIANNRNGNWRAFEVPAGRWSVGSLISGMITLNLCLGAPAFEVRSGEVVYAGAFDFGAAQLGPDLSIGPAQEWMREYREAPIRTAEYTNGWEGPCSGNEIYALEIPGAPFRDGYYGGSVLNLGAPAEGSPSEGN